MQFETYTRLTNSQIKTISVLIRKKLDEKKSEMEQMDKALRVKNFINVNVACGEGSISILDIFNNINKIYQVYEKEEPFKEIGLFLHEKANENDSIISKSTTTYLYELRKMWITEEGDGLPYWTKEKIHSFDGYNFHEKVDAINIINRIVEYEPNLFTGEEMAILVSTLGLSN